MNKRIGIILVALAICIATVFLFIASHRVLSSLENILFQIFSLGVGLVGSYILGKQSALKAARDLLKPHARSAFRRLVSLYRGLTRDIIAIRAARPVNVSEPIAASILDKLEGMFIEQIGTADDAMEDWRDIVPEDVEELRAQLKPRDDTEKTK